MVSEDKEGYMLFSLFPGTLRERRSALEQKEVP